LSTAQLIIYGILGIAFLILLVLHPRFALLFLWSILSRVAAAAAAADFKVAAAGRAAAAQEGPGDMMWWLNRTRLARSFDHDRIKRAIEDAEQATSGTIVVSVAPYFIGSVRRAAEIAFKRLGVVQSQHRNGVLSSLSPAGASSWFWATSPSTTRSVQTFGRPWPRVCQRDSALAT